MTQIGLTLFPPFVAYQALRYGDDEAAHFAAMELPPEIDRAVPKRRAEFAAGRWCAHGALNRIGPEHAAAAVPIGADRAPVWPDGIVGSIAHTRGFAAAAVARAADASGVGLDSERIVPPKMVDAMRAHVATPGELEALRGRAELDELTLLTVVFSAKESLFKCLYRRAGRLFGFSAATLVEVSVRDASFVAELREELGDLARGRSLAGRFVVDGDLVHTALTLPGVARLAQ